MAQGWTRAELVTEFRLLAGRSSTSDLSDSSVADLINDYYQNHFPEELQVAEFHTDWTQDTAMTDDGEYDLAQTVVTVGGPVLIDKAEVSVYFDKTRFFNRYPDEETYNSAPTLAIGSSSTSAVANSAFTYRLGGVTYSLAAAETELSGDTVAQGKYGAWALSVDQDGTVTVTEAADNATGYDTAALAVSGISAPVDECIMGYVTVIDGDSTFVPGTTGLDGSGVTDTYTDGNPGYRMLPESVLIYGGYLYARPKADDIYRIEAPLTLQRPSALSGDSSTLGDIRWGPYIAARVAELFCRSRNDHDKANALAVLVADRRCGIIKKRVLQWIRSNRPTQPVF